MDRTKAVATRIPFEDYIDLLQKVTSKNMSISDYLLLKLYQDDSDDSKISMLQEKLSDAKSKISDLANKNKVLNESLGQLKKRIKELEEKPIPKQEEWNLIRKSEDELSFPSFVSALRAIGKTKQQYPFHLEVGKFVYINKYKIARHSERVYQLYIKKNG